MKISKVVFSFVLSFILLINIPVSAETKQVKTFKLDEKNYFSTEEVDYSQSFESFLISAFDNHIERVDVLRFNIPDEDLNKILIDILNKYPKYFCVNLSNSTYYVYKSLVLQINLSYRFSKDECSEKQVEIDKVLEKPLKAIGRLDSAEEKFLFIHDYIITHNAYDEDGLSGEVDKVSENSFNAYGCLVLKKSVCQGISDAFILVCQKAGLNAYYVSSDNMCHAWNIVELNGNYYHLDTTWDDSSTNNYYGFNDIKGLCSHRYFLKSDSQFERLSHSNWDSSLTAEDSTTYLNAYWNSVSTAIYFINGYAYYIKDLCFIRRDLSEDTETVLLDQTESDTASVNKNSVLAYDYNGDYIFINLSDGIYAFDTKTDNLFKVFEEKESIIGIAFESGVLKYDSVSEINDRFIQNVSKTAKVVFPSDKVLLGDINGSGKFDISDILSLKKALIGDFDGLNVFVGDMNSDGKTDLLDLVLMRKKLSSI